MVTEAEVEAGSITMSRLMYRHEGNFSTVDWRAVARDVLTAAAAARPAEADLDEKTLRSYLATLAMAAVAGEKGDLAEATNNVIRLVRKSGARKSTLEV